MIIKVPLRISFIGGGTDIPPYPDKYGGHTFSCTIDKYAIVTDENIFPGVTNYNDLIEAAKKKYSSPYINLQVACEMPPGSGLGTSSSIAVGLVKYFEPDLNPDDLAITAIQLERKEAGISGGNQDQYCAAFCGVNEFKFGPSFKADVTPYTPYHYFDHAEFQSKLLLVDTGVIRRQANIMDTQIKRMEDGFNLGHLDAIKNLTQEFIFHVKYKYWKVCGEILTQSWHLKKKLSSGIYIEQVDDILQTAIQLPTIYGGKLLGAGGGGYVLLMCGNRDSAYHFMTSKGFRCIKPNVTYKSEIEGIRNVKNLREPIEA